MCTLKSANINYSKIFIINLFISHQYIHTSINKCTHLFVISIVDRKETNLITRATVQPEKKKLG